MNCIGDLSTNCNPEILYVVENTDSFIRMPILQSSIHSHDCIELSIILSGTAHYTIEDTHHLAQKGDVFFFNPGINHAVSIPIQAHYSDLHIGIQNFLFPNGQVDILPLISTHPLIDLKNHKEDFFMCCMQIVNECHHFEEGQSLMFKALITKLLLLIYRSLYTKRSAQTENISKKDFVYPEKQKIVSAMLDYIHKNYKTDMSLDMFAKDMYLSQVYLSKLFKEEVQTSPINYLIKIRLSHAKELLETTDLSIKNVALNVGYEDVYHFSKIFKKYYGCPPSVIKGHKKR